jgi:autotransporter-associated beta strand protein
MLLLPRCFRWFGVLVLLLGLGSALGQTLVITNGVQTYATVTDTTVILSNRCELRVTAASNPISGSLIHLNSADAYFILENVKPSVVVASYMAQIRINGAVAVADNNCRVVQYGVGTIVLPQASGFQPLQVFSGPHFTGSSNFLSRYVYYKGAALGVMDANISSFKLKRGYTATLAQNENGSGHSRNYVAQDGDLEVSLLPGALDNRVRFVYVTPWRWVSKKGSCDASPTDLQASWWYNWNLNQNSTRDLEYVAIKQQPHWPGLNENWQTRGINHLLGFNEPNNPVEDAYENLTPPGSVSDAVARWPELLGTGLRVGAPAVTDGGQGWITDFMNQAEAANMRVDYVPIHFYRCFSNNNDPAGAANQLYNFLKGIYDMAKRPLWVTEFNNGANWTGCADPTYAQNAAVIQAMIQMMDNTPWIERYSVYSKVEFSRQTHYDEGGLTPMGVMYRDHVAPLAYVQALPNNGTRSFSQLRFDGDTRDSSGYGNNALAAGSAAYTNGVRGEALVFDGTNTILTLPPNIANNNGFTFAAWINWSGGGNWQRIFDFGNSTTHYLFLTPSSGNGTLRFAIRNGGSEQIVESAALPVNQWRHVALTLNGNTARLYVNGAQVAVNAGVSLTPANFNPRMNTLGDSQFIADPLFRGLMDEVLITDYALSVAQIAGLQTNNVPQFTNSIFARGAATEGLSYSNSIAGTATDADPGDTLTYSKAAGPAWLDIATDGTMTGIPTSADGGINYFTVRVTDAAGQNAFALVTITTTVVSANGVWTADANGVWGESIRWLSGSVATGAGRTADFSTINITANRTVTLDSSRSIGTLRFGDTIGAQSWTITNSNDSELILDTASATPPAVIVTNSAQLALPVAGTNGFVKSGPGTLILSADNSLSGVFNLDRGLDGNNHDGITRIAHPNAADDAESILIRNTSVGTAGGATLQLDGSAGSIELTQFIGMTCRNNSTTPAIQNLNGTNTLSGFIGLNAGGNMFNIQSDSGLLVLSGTNQYIGGLTGGRSYAFSGAGNHLVSGPIRNSTNGAPIGLIKTGTGTLTLGGVNTYTNTTTVSGGTLLVNGATAAASAITVGSSATLGGNGNINGPVTLQFNSTLAPGTSVGKLAVNNSVTLQAGSTTRMEISALPKTNDVLQVTGAFTRGGTLVVTNMAGDLAPGDSFTLFQTPNASGAFTTVSLPPLNFGLAWNTNNLNVGVISVVATNPPLLTNWAWQPDGSFALNGIGAASQGYTLHAATNLATPVVWLPVTNVISATDGTFLLHDAQAADHPQRFYRVVAP